MEKYNKSDLFDTVFIMLLCFATLLTTMLLQGGVIVGGEGNQMSYKIDGISFTLTMGTLVAYIYFVLKQSDKELRKMIDHIYKSGRKKKKII